MYRRPASALALGLVAVFAVACGGGVSGALGEFFEQVRLDDPLVQRTYAENEALIMSPESIPTLIEHLEADPSAKVRQWCALLLGRIGDPQAIQPLTNALADTDKGTRDRAVGALIQIGEAEAETAFIAALASDSREAKLTALIELEKVASTSAIPAIAELAAANDGMVSKNAIDALGGIGDPAAARPLAAIALDAGIEAGLRRQAIMNLGRISAPEADAALAEVLSGLADEEGSEELVQLAQDQGH